MMNLGWARCASSVADVLRRGAWYPIVERSPDGHVVVAVRGRSVRLNRDDVKVRAELPDRWSIVFRPGVLRPAMGGRGREVVNTYAVCPHCHERQDFVGLPATMRCTRCGTASPVDWSETC